MKRIWFTLLAGVACAVVFSAIARADTAVVVANCGTLGATYPVGNFRSTTIDTNGVLCTGAATGAAPVVQGSLIDRAVTIATGGTAQVAMSANPSRRLVACQNISNEDFWFRFTGTAAANAAGSFRLMPGAAFEHEGSAVPTQALSVVSATTGSKLSCVEM